MLKNTEIELAPRVVPSTRTITDYRDTNVLITVGDYIHWLYEKTAKDVTRIHSIEYTLKGYTRLGWDKLRSEAFAILKKTLGDEYEGLAKWYGAKSFLVDCFLKHLMVRGYLNLREVREVSLSVLTREYYDRVNKKWWPDSLNTTKPTTQPTIKDVIEMNETNETSVVAYEKVHFINGKRHDECTVQDYVEAVRRIDAEIVALQGIDNDTVTGLTKKLRGDRAKVLKLMDKVHS